MGDIADLYDYGYWPDDDQPSECRYCGAQIEWVLTDKWRAYTESGKRHLCKPFLATVRSTPQEDFA